MSDFTMLHAIRFVMAALEEHAINADDVLWAEADFINVGSEGKLGDNMFQLTLRENLDGAGRVKCYLVSLKEIEP